MVRITERLYLTADRKKVVKENDRSGAILFAKVGDEIDDETARGYGLLASSKAAPPAPNKASPPAPNKASGVEWPAESKRGPKKTRGE